MNRLWYLLIFAFLIGALLRAGHDLTHPELWADWQHAPVWGVLIILLVAFMAGLFLWAWREDRRRARLTREERLEEDLRLLTKGRRR